MATGNLGDCFFIYYSSSSDKEETNELLSESVSYYPTYLFCYYVGT